MKSFSHSEVDKTFPTSVLDCASESAEYVASLTGSSRRFRVTGLERLAEGACLSLSLISSSPSASFPCACEEVFPLRLADFVYFVKDGGSCFPVNHLGIKRLRFSS